MAGPRGGGQSCSTVRGARAGSSQLPDIFTISTGSLVAAMPCQGGNPHLKSALTTLICVPEILIISQESLVGARVNQGAWSQVYGDFVHYRVHQRLFLRCICEAQALAGAEGY